MKVWFRYTDREGNQLFTEYCVYSSRDAELVDAFIEKNRIKWINYINFLNVGIYEEFGLKLVWIIIQRLLRKDVRRFMADEKAVNLRLFMNVAKDINQKYNNLFATLPPAVCIWIFSAENFYLAHCTHMIEAQRTMFCGTVEEKLEVAFGIKR